MIVASLIEIPELLAVVVENSDKSTCARLAQTSRGLFEVVMPILWENTEGAHKIFALLPDSIMDPVRSSDPSFKAPNVFDPVSVDVTRFNVYAPLVKSLQIYDTADTTQRTAIAYNWAFLTSFARHKPLLPNLKHLVINQQRGGSTQEKWISILATRALQTVCAPLIPHPRLLSYPPSMSLSMASAASAVLSEFATNLRLLEIYPITPSGNLKEVGEKGLATSGLPSPYRVFYNSLGNLTALRKLSITAIVFEPRVFGMVCNLPYLESLYVHKISQSPPNFIKDSLPSNSFRSLKQFTLIDFDETHLQVIFDWGPLVGKLHGLRVRTSNARYMSMNWARDIFIPLLRHCSPELTEFLCENTHNNQVLSMPFTLGISDLK